MLKRAEQLEGLATAEEPFDFEFWNLFRDDPRFMTCDSLDVPQIIQLNKLLDQAMRGSAGS